MMWFILAMLLYPDVQKKAQDEIDNAIGSDGKIIPSFTNFAELPYCTALCREVFRYDVKSIVNFDTMLSCRV